MPSINALQRIFNHPNKSRPPKGSGILAQSPGRLVTGVADCLARQYSTRTTQEEDEEEEEEEEEEDYYAFASQ